MIIDFVSGAISQQPTALPMGAWNWSIVEGADAAVIPQSITGSPTAVPSVMGRVRAVEQVTGGLGAEPSVTGPVRVG